MSSWPLCAIVTANEKAITTIASAIRSVAPFRCLSDDDLDVLTRATVRRTYRRNQLIFSQGDPGDGLYVIESGRASIARIGPTGAEMILTLEEPGDYFGELALFDDEPRSAGATAVGDSVFLFLSRGAFQRFLDENTDAVRICLQMVVRQLRRCTDLVDELALLDVRSRLARRLLYLSGGSSLVGGEGMRITQQQLAGMTGTTRESINKHLNGLVDAGIIRLEHGHIAILDREALEDCSLGSL